jgi:hypothetical protein
MFKIAQNETNPTKSNMIYKALRLPRDFEQKNAPPTFSHGEGRWGKGLRTIINQGIVITNLTKKTPPILST